MNFFRLRNAGDVRVLAGPDSQRLKRIVVVGESEIHRRRNRKAGGEASEATRTRRIEVERDKPIRCGVGKRSQDHAVEHAEDGGIRSDTDGECQQDRDRKARRLAQAAKNKFQIGEHRFKRGPLPCLAAPLLHQSDIAKFTPCRLFCIGSSHALGDKLVGPLCNVFLDRNRKIVVATGTTKQPSKQIHHDSKEKFPAPAVD